MNDIPRSLIQINDHVWIDTGRMTVIRDGNETPLTARMWHLLKVLLDHPNVVLSDDALIYAGWPDDPGHSANELYQQIHRIRQLIEDDPRHPVILTTRRGLGYLINIPPHRKPWYANIQSQSGR